jgi:hypothetical protein
MLQHQLEWDGQQDVRENLSSSKKDHVGEKHPHPARPRLAIVFVCLFVLVEDLRPHIPDGDKAGYICDCIVYLMIESR